MGKTETTYLIDGDPKGTQYVFLVVGSYRKTKDGQTLDVVYRS